MTLSRLFCAALFVVGISLSSLNGHAEETSVPEPQSSLITHISYPQVMDLLDGTGITAELITSDDGVSYLVGTYNNTSFIMRLIECESEKLAKCTTLAIFANFLEDEGAQISGGDKNKINGYNENEIFGRAYYSADGTALGIDMVISIEGGVTEAFFKAQLDNWTSALGLFLSQLAKPQ